MCSGGVCKLPLGLLSREVKLQSALGAVLNLTSRESGWSVRWMHVFWELLLADGSIQQQLEGRIPGSLSLDRGSDACWIVVNYYLNC